MDFILSHFFPCLNDDNKSPFGGFLMNIVDDILTVGKEKERMEQCGLTNSDMHELIAIIDHEPYA